MEIKAGKGQARKITSDWYAVKPIPNPENKRVDFELVTGRKGKGTTIIYNDNPVVRASRSLGISDNSKDTSHRR